MSAVHYLIEAKEPPKDRDILLWDSIEEEWRISHYHSAPELGDNSGWAPMSQRDLETAREDYPSYGVPIMSAPTHWAEMPRRPIL